MKPIRLHSRREVIRSLVGSSLLLPGLVSNLLAETGGDADPPGGTTAGDDEAGDRCRDRFEQIDGDPIVGEVSGSRLRVGVLLRMRPAGHQGVERRFVGVVAMRDRADHGVKMREPCQLREVLANAEAVERRGDRVELAADLLVLPVEVWLARVEQMQIPLAVRHAAPGRPAEHRLPVGRWLAAVLALAVLEDVARPLGRAWRGGQGVSGDCRSARQHQVQLPRDR